MARKSNTSPQTLRLLQALILQPGEWRYGYDLSRETGLKSGTLYPQLMRLEASGWLEAQWEEAAQNGKPPRHMYRLTGVGLREGASILNDAKGSIDLIRSPARPEAVDGLNPALEHAR